HWGSPSHHYSASHGSAVPMPRKGSPLPPPNVWRRAAWLAIVAPMLIAARHVVSPPQLGTIIINGSVRDSMNSIWSRNNAHWNELAGENTLTQMIGSGKPTQREYMGCMQGSISHDTLFVTGSVPSHNMRQLQFPSTAIATTSRTSSAPGTRTHIGLRPTDTRSKKRDSRSKISKRSRPALTPPSWSFGMSTRSMPPHAVRMAAYFTRSLWSCTERSRTSAHAGQDSRFLHMEPVLTEAARADVATAADSSAVSPGTTTTAHEKEQRLVAWLAARPSVILGFSGGVDSAYLACVALDVLGTARFLAVIGRSPSYPDAQWDAARALAAQFGIPVLEVDTHEMLDARYVANPSNRCYFCKTELWSVLRA